MGRYEEQHWTGAEHGTRRDRRSGTYRAYVPDPMMAAPTEVYAEAEAALATAERALAARRTAGWDIGHLDGLVLRTETAASSMIEGVVPRAKQVAFAELHHRDDDLGSPTDQARLVANNAAVMRYVRDVLADKPAITLDDIIDLQRQLLPAECEWQGIRTTQNWIGGSQSHPFEAAYVAPPPQHVRRLMDDLVAFLNDTRPSPLVQAALVHAQFESIHPFADGNGRVGRALIQLVLARRHVLGEHTLPVSVILLTRKDEYIRALADYHFDGDPDSPQARRARSQWVTLFSESVVAACAQAEHLAADIADLRDAWQLQLIDSRRNAGMTRPPRADSAVLRLLDHLLRFPVTTAEVAREEVGGSPTAISNALRELAQADIVTIRSSKGRPVYFADDLLGLLDLTERRLASPSHDTATDPPARAVPPLPDRTVPTSSGWSRAAQSVWAKTEKDGETDMALVQHLTDAAAVAGELWDNWLSPNVRRIISAGLPGGLDDGRRLVVWAAGVHDIGKATPGFAVKALMNPKWAYLVDRMAKEGLVCPRYVRGSGEKLPPHCRLGHHLVVRWLAERYDVVGDRAHTWALPIGGHHGIQPTSDELQHLRGSKWLGEHEQRWRTVQDEILNAMAERSGAAERLAEWTTHPLPAQAQALVSAVVVVADWLASDPDRFPLGMPQPGRLEHAGLEGDLPQPWQPGDPPQQVAEAMSRRFPALKGIRPNATQRAAYEIACATEESALMIIEAPMGAGKTEAALLAAEAMAKQTGAGGVFIALPTMATSDAMFGRVLDWTRHLDAGTRSSVYLAHGKARLNDAYRGLAKVGRFTSVNEAEDSGEASAAVAMWLTGRRKGVLANMVVGTIDQVLFGALQTRYLALRHLALAGKVVVIDEVHAADDFMRSYLCLVLEWLGAYGISVVLLSATLPPAQRSQLVNAYARGRHSSPPQLDAGDAYPLITVSGSQTRQYPVPWDGGERPVRVVPFSDDLDELRSRVTNFVNDGACVIVVRNTVARAQDAYDVLVDDVGGERIMLLHSRFVAVDRAERETRLRGMLGRDAKHRPRGFVVVGTQVLEQSLDIDADVMFTDLAPIDLVLQRIGRLHRHLRGVGQSDRPITTRRAQVFVTGVESWSAQPPIFDAGSGAVYGADRLLRSAAVLAPYLAGAPLSVPHDIPGLVRDAYDDGMPPPQGWEQQWTTAGEDARRKRDDQLARAEQFQIRHVRSRKGPALLGWVTTPKSDDEQQAGRAAVRDSEDGLEVILVQKDRDGVRLLPDAGPLGGAELGIVSAYPPPTEELALAAANSTVRLPARLTKPWLIDRVIDEIEDLSRDFVGWQSSQWLKGLLILPLDDCLTASVAGTTLRYDVERGLIVTEADDD